MLCFMPRFTSTFYFHILYVSFYVQEKFNLKTDKKTAGILCKVALAWYTETFHG